MNTYNITGEVQRFEGKYGWHYVELDSKLSSDLRPLLNNSWPALLRASFKINTTKWESSIMPIQDGPLFIALPARIRKAEDIHEGKLVEIEFTLP
jgi:hypothetical protein